MGTVVVKFIVLIFLTVYISSTEFIKANRCHSNQFKCESDKRCINEDWRCDGEEDCSDGSDENECGESQIDSQCKQTHFECDSNNCIPRNWLCDGERDCTDGSDEMDCGNTCENKNCSHVCKNTTIGAHCFCNDGYELDMKDNETCNDINECKEEGFCSHKCINTVGSYTCICQKGYNLVNRTCRATGDDPVLVYSTMKEIRKLNLRLNLDYPIRQARTKASVVDIDQMNGRLYWVELSNRSAIYSSEIDGTDLKTVLSHGLQIPENIAVDYIANNIYITDSGLQQVLACKIDGTMCHVLHVTNVQKPRAIVLELNEGLMYWSDWGEKSAGIYSSGMDGSRRLSLVASRVGWPNGITVDLTTNRLYWADAKLGTIEYITLDGSSRKVISKFAVFHPYSLAVFEDNIYWSDWKSFSLESCDKFSGHKTTIIAPKNGNIFGVKVYHPVLASKVSNPCLSSNCSHMCLISPENGFSCACPNGFDLSTDGKTCIKGEGDASIFISEGSSVFHIHPNSVGSEALQELSLSLGEPTITRVSYDSRSGHLFVGDANKPAIYMINTTSLQTEELARNHVSSPEDLAFDWKSNNLYWIDSIKRTAKVINVNLLRTVTILTNLRTPVALAISPSSGHMFIATIGIKAAVTMYGMDGKDERVLNSVQGIPISIAVHPSKSILYWADPGAEIISCVDYTDSRSLKIVKTKLDGLISLTVNEEYIFWTGKRRELNMLKGDVTHVLPLPGEGKTSFDRKVTYSPGVEAGLSECLIENGGCSYVCLTSPTGRTCACSSDLLLSSDNVTCIAKECDVNDFKCMNGRCLPADQRCDGSTDCEDGSDEKDCNNRCSGDDFQCKNGQCILKSWRCDHRNDCNDNSDEQDCPACYKDQIMCANGECIPMLWRCDGEADCSESSDERNCNETRCNNESQLRCDNGQCVPISWACDGRDDCFDGSDEKICTEKTTCSNQEFRCESDGSCIKENLRCDGKANCVDESDEKNCTQHHDACKKLMFSCKDGSCIYDYEVCDGHYDCGNNEDEMNCTHAGCQSDEILCTSSKRCISRKWICDGDEDCSDGSDEENCGVSSTHPPTLPPMTKDCDGFYCYATGRCLPWSKVCDGRLDCEDLPDEGGLCKNSCAGGNGDCSHICTKTPFGSKCFCNKGYRLIPDNKTCVDIDECREPGTCSHFCNNTMGSFKCSCADGYFLHHDHRFCEAEAGPAILMYLLGDQIRRFDLSSRMQKVYIKMENADIRGMDYDAAEGTYYWTDLKDGSLNKFLDEKNIHEVIFKSPLKPVLVKYDWIAKMLYYLDAFSNIGVCTREGKFCRVLVRSTDKSLESLDISPTSGLMFWTIWANLHRYLYSGLIERAEMNGSRRIIIVSDNTMSPSSVTVDHVLKMIYWSDKQMNTLECADFHGFQRRRIVQSNIHHPFAIALFEDSVYWADWGTESIMRCHKFIKEDCEKILVNVKTHMLLIAHKAMQPAGKKAKTCSVHEFQCESDGSCIRDILICNGKAECRDASDEKNCTRNQDAELIFYNEGPSVFVKERNDVGAESVKLLPFSLRHTPIITGLSYDAKSKDLFVADRDRPAIYAIGVSNLHVRALVTLRITSPNDIAFDWMSNNLYWVDSSKGTTEVISIDTLKRKVILEDLERPVSLAISPYRGIMFVSTIGNEGCVSMYGMDGKNKRILHSVQGLPMSLALHPSKTILYWADQRAGMISYVNYSSSSPPWILKSGINGIMSVAASEDTVYWTAQEKVLPTVPESVHYTKISEHENETVWKNVAYSRGIKPSGKSECLIENGGCSYLCLTSPNGRTCACSPSMTLASDGKNCLGKICESNDFKCVNGQCIPAEMECDGSIECIDGSDELICDRVGRTSPVRQRTSV